MGNKTMTRCATSPAVQGGEDVNEQKVQSVAIPALGAGLGGLDWKNVRRVIERELAGMETEIMVYEAMK